MSSQEKLQKDGLIILRMVDENGYDFDFIVPIDQEFGSTRWKYGCCLKLPDDKQVVIYYHGKQIDDEETPEGLDMEWDDMVVAKVIDRVEKPFAQEKTSKKHAVMKSKEIEANFGNKSVEEICVAELPEASNIKSNTCKLKLTQHENAKKRKNEANKSPKFDESKQGPSADGIVGHFEHESDEFFKAKSEHNENVRMYENLFDEKFCEFVKRCKTSQINDDYVRKTPSMNDYLHDDFNEMRRKNKPVSLIVQIGYGSKELIEKLAQQKAERKAQQKAIDQNSAGAISSKPIIELMDDVKHCRIEIEEDSIGNDYGTIFSQCFGEDVKTIRVVEPWIFARHQVFNFKNFCGLAASKCANLEKIWLITRPTQEKDDWRTNEFEKIKFKRKIELTVELLKEQHDREIVFDNGWTVKIGRGLDYFKPASFEERNVNTPFIAYDKKKCKKTTVDMYFYQPK